MSMTIAMQAHPDATRNRPRRAWTVGVVVALAIAGFACSEANPLPSPIVTVNGDLTFLSSLGPDETTGSVTLVGLPGAVDAAGEVEIYMPTGILEETISLSADGAFATALEGVSAGLELELRPVPDSGPDGVEVEPLFLVVRQVAAQDAYTPWILPQRGTSSDEAPALGGLTPDDDGIDGQPGNFAELGGIDVSTPDGQGMVTVSGQSYAVTPQSLVLVLHAASGRPYETQSDNLGKFSLRLAAASGDGLLLFAANAGDNELTTETLPLEVP